MYSGEREEVKIQKDTKIAENRKPCRRSRTMAPKSRNPEGLQRHGGQEEGWCDVDKLHTISGAF